LLLNNCSGLLQLKLSFVSIILRFLRFLYFNTARIIIDNKITPAMGTPISIPVLFGPAEPAVAVGVLELKLITEDMLKVGVEGAHLETLYEYGEGEIPEHVMPPSPSLTHIAAPTGCPELSTPQ
jgi:hypothetical protein